MRGQTLSPRHPEAAKILRAVHSSPKEPPRVANPVVHTYLSLAAFYAADPARRGSRERDFGLFWRSRTGLSFRAAWVCDTGELYLFQHALGGRGGGSVRLLRPALREEELEQRLEGWEDVCGEEGSFEWLLARMGGPPASDPPRRRFQRRADGRVLRLGGPAGAAA